MTTVQGFIVTISTRWWS